MAQDFVDRIYEAAALPQLWSGLLHDIALEHGFAGGALVTSSEEEERGVASEGLEELALRYFTEGWNGRFLRCDRVEASGYDGFLSDRDVVSEEEFETAPVYVELLRPLGFGGGASTFVIFPSGDKAFFSFERSLASGETPRAAVEALDQLRPHFARACVFATRFDLERSRAQVAALGGIGLPAAVVGAGRNVLAANAGFEELSEQIRIGALDRVSLADPCAETLFAMALAANEGKSIPLRAAGASLPCVLHVLPVRREARDVFSHANWLLVATPLGASAASVGSILRVLFDLSPAEARVAHEVVNGETVAGIAAKFGLGVPTIRTQMRAVFAKTGASRQAELVALCSTIGMAGEGPRVAG